MATDNKYDRQLRLWGSHGQVCAASVATLMCSKCSPPASIPRPCLPLPVVSDSQRRLAEAHVCLLGAGPTGSEALKNLVLPGCGRFTIVDSAPVSAPDLGNNFFVDPSWLGKPRAEAVAALLQEMNPDVTGEACVGSVEEVLAREPGFFAKFTLVIATQLPEAQVASVEAILRPLGIPLVVRRGRVGVNCFCVCVVESCACYVCVHVYVCTLALVSFVS